MVEQFISVLRCIDIDFLDEGYLEELPMPSTVGHCRVAGIDINKPRMRAVVEAVICLSVVPKGFTSSQVASEVRGILGTSDYKTRHASYDLKKLRGKGIIIKVVGSHKYRATHAGLRSIATLHCLLDKVIKPLVAREPIKMSRSMRRKRRRFLKSKEIIDINEQYSAIQMEVERLLDVIGLSAI
jgi:hypothetical protein